MILLTLCNLCPLCSWQSRIWPTVEQPNCSQQIPVADYHVVTLYSWHWLKPPLPQVKEYDLEATARPLTENDLGMVDQGNKIHDLLITLNESKIWCTKFLLNTFIDGRGVDICRPKFCKYDAVCDKSGLRIRSICGQGACSMGNYEVTNQNNSNTVYEQNPYWGALYKKLRFVNVRKVGTNLGVGTFTWIFMV